MLESLTQVAKAVAAWFAVTVTNWVSTKWGFIISGDIVEILKGLGESALLGLVGFIAVYFAPKNTPVTISKS
jgi:hypothetical protein